MDPAIQDRQDQLVNARELTEEIARAVNRAAGSPFARMKLTLPTIGVVLVLVGLALFLVGLNVTNHDLLTVVAILAILAGGLVLFGVGVPYSGLLFGAVVVVSMLMGSVLVGILGSLRGLKRRPAITGKEGMIGEVGTVKSPVGVDSEGWVLVHGERWKAVLAFAPEEPDLIEAEALIGIGHKVMVVGFGERSVVQVVPMELPGRGPDLDRPG